MSITPRISSPNLACYAILLGLYLDCHYSSWWIISRSLTFKCRIKCSSLLPSYGSSHNFRSSSTSIGLPCRFHVHTRSCTAGCGSRLEGRRVQCRCAWPEEGEDGAAVRSTAERTWETPWEKLRSAWVFALDRKSWKELGLEVFAIYGLKVKKS